MSYILHIDTSTDSGIVALNEDGRLLAFLQNDESRNHAATINTMIDSLLEAAHLSLAQIDAVVVCAGPGSYTGLRIGLATAKGICYALDKPLIMDNRLDLLAFRPFTAHGTTYDAYIACVVAREQEYFISIYDNQFNSTLSPRHIMQNELQNVVSGKSKTYLIGNAPQDAITLSGFENPTVDTDLKVDLASWCTYAYNKFMCCNIENLAMAEPFYLKQVYTHK